MTRASTLFVVAIVVALGACKGAAGGGSTGSGGSGDGSSTGGGSASGGGGGGAPDAGSTTGSNPSPPQAPLLHGAGDSDAISLWWDAPPGPDLSFDVVELLPDGTRRPVETTADPGSLVEGVQLGSAHSYVVVARNAAGASGDSNRVDLVAREAGTAELAGPATTTRITAAGTETAPTDLTTYNLSAIVAGPGDATTWLPGAGGVGSFVVARLPDPPGAAPPLLRVVPPPQAGRTVEPRYVEAPGRTIDLGTGALGRASAAVGSPGSSVSFALDLQVDPWASGDALELVNVNAGNVVTNLEALATPAPSVGSTALRFAVPWTALRLQDVGDGPTLVVHQALVGTGAGRYWASRTGAMLPAFAMTDGASTAAPAATLSFLPGTPRTVMVPYRPSPFFDATGATPFHAGLLPQDRLDSVDIVQPPGGDQLGQISPHLFLASWAGAPGSIPPAMAFDVPLPDRPLYLLAQSAWTVPLLAPGATQPFTTAAGTVRQLRLDALPSGDLAPTVAPVTNLAVTPVPDPLRVDLSWDHVPPANGPAPVFHAGLFRLTNDGGTTRQAPLATVATSEKHASVRLDRTTLQPGDGVYAAVTATVAADESLARPDVAPMARASSTVVSDVQPAPPCPCFVRLNWIQAGSFVRTLAKLYAGPIDDVYHAALTVQVPEGTECVVYVVELTFYRESPQDQAAVGQVKDGTIGVAGTGALGFKYGIRRWRNGRINDSDTHTLIEPKEPLSTDCAVARNLLSLVDRVPTNRWGVDDNGYGERWSSNSVVAWLLENAGIDARLALSVNIPPGGIAPGWNAGIVAPHAFATIKAQQYCQDLLLSSYRQPYFVSVTSSDPACVAVRYELGAGTPFALQNVYAHCIDASKPCQATVTVTLKNPDQSVPATITCTPKG